MSPDVGLACKNCRHWNTGHGGKSSREHMFDGSKECHRLQVLQQYGEPCAGNAAIATPPEFFCSLFEVETR